MEPVTIQIPTTIGEVKSRLGGIERLLTAKGWERAAIVYAFTYEPGPGGDRKSPEWNQRVKSNADSKLSCNEFAGLGIQGLRSNQTVYEHRRTWQSAIDAGDAVDPRPGDIVGLPDRDYPSVDRPRGLAGSLMQDRPVETTYEAIKAVIAQKPEVAERIESDFVQKAGQDVKLAARIDRVYQEFHPTPVPRPEPTSDFATATLYDYSGLIYAAIQRQQDAHSRLLRHLESHQLTAAERVHLDHHMQMIEKCQTMLTQIKDGVSNAAGVDYDEVFRRLVNG